MKTLRFIGVVLLTVLMSVSFSACGDDDDESSSGGNPLVGTWVGLKGESGWQNDHKLVFNNNGTGKWIENDKYTDPFNYTYTSTVITIDFGDGSPEKWRYSISGNVLYMGKGENVSNDKMFKLTKQ